MIKKDLHQVGWAMLMYELEDAKGHLESMIEEMDKDLGFSEENFRIDLGHIYAHLNRAWQIRNFEDVSTEERDSEIDFPKDIEPI